MLYNQKKSVVNIFFLLCSLIFSLVFQPAFALEQKVIKSNGLYFWTESFGSPKDPALVLIMGSSGGQGTHNPDSANNHFQAIKASYDLQKGALSKIKAPTRIVHGNQDPIF